MKAKIPYERIKENRVETRHESKNGYWCYFAVFQVTWQHIRDFTLYSIILCWEAVASTTCMHFLPPWNCFCVLVSLFSIIHPCCIQITKLTSYPLHYKYLGITLDANLNFHEHVDRLHCKLSSRLGALRRTRKHLIVDAANKVYTATILPLLDYCDIAWSSIGKTACARLDKLQERASKLILSQSREPLKHLKWLALAKRRDMHTTTMTFRCMSGKVPVSFKQYFKRNSCPYELWKNKNNLMIPRVNTEIARGSFYYSGAKLYNNLPNKIKTSLSMSTLKKFYFK